MQKKNAAFTNISNKLCALLQFAVVVLLSNTRGQSRAYMIVSALRFDITDQS